MAENFPNLGEETDIQVQEVQSALNKMSPKRLTARHAVIKMAKVKNKDTSGKQQDRTESHTRETP